MFEITTNEGKYIIHNCGESTVKRFMFMYIRKKMSKGLKLSDILFAYQIIQPNAVLSEIVGKA